MSCQVGGQNVTAIKWCNAQGTLVDISSVQKDGATLWSSAPSPTDDFLTFTANEAGSTVRLDWCDKDVTQNVMYNLNDEGWTAYTKDSTITLVNVGDFVRFKGTQVYTDSSHRFCMSGSISGSGSVTSIFDGVGVDNTVMLNDNQWEYMFYDCAALVSAPKIIPVTVNGVCCMYGMFMWSGISAAPTLCAQTIGGNALSCYKYMFRHCTNVTSVDMKTGCGYDETENGALAGDHAITINYI